jgi:iron(III) transport system ATP-binding protein
VLEPAVLLFDEPLSNLDTGLRRHMRGEIRDLQQRLGLTVVYVTHDQAEAMAISDRIMIMDRGVIAQDGAPRALYEAPASEFVAGFMGEANVVEGRLQAHEGALGVVELGPLRHRIPHRGQPLGRVAVAIRPEAIVVGPLRSDGLKATVATVAYLGAVVEYTLASELGELFAIGSDVKAPFAPGDAVSVTLADHGVAIIPARKE